MLAGLQTDQRFGGLGVQLLEERVDATLFLISADRILGPEFAWRGAPFDQAALDLIARSLVWADNLGQDARVVHDGEQVVDDCVGIGGFERLVVQRKSLGSTQPASIKAEPGNVEVAAERRCAFASATGIGDAGVHAGLIGESPGGFEPLGAEAFDRVVLLFGEEVGLDAQVAAQFVEQHMHQLNSGGRFRCGQGCRGARPLRLISSHAVETKVGQAQLAGLLQVGHGDAPSALQISPHPVGQDIPQCAFDSLGRNGLMCGHGVAGEMGEVSTECVENRSAEIVVGQRLFGVALLLLLRRPVQGGTHQADENEVVEVP